MGAGKARKLILAILIIGLILRLISLNQSLWLDEAINVLASKNYSFLAMIAEYAKGDFHPPGWFIILWFWTKLFGYSEVAVRIPSVIFGVISIYVTYLIGKKLISKEVGIIAALIMCLNPLHIYYSQEARMYSLATLVVAINIYLFIKLIKQEKINYFYFILSNFLVLMSDYVAYFIFPAELMVLFLMGKIASPRQRRGLAMTWVGCLIVSIILSIWWLPTFLGQLNVGSVASANLPTWKFVLGTFDIKAIPLTYIKFIIGRISYPDKLIYGLILLPISILYLFLLIYGIKTLRSIERSLILCWLLIPIILASFVSLFIPIYSYFRVLYVLPAFVILLAVGISVLKTKLKYGVVFIVILIELFACSVYLFNPAFHREDWKGLVSFLKSKKPAVVLFESSGTLSPFDYYAKKDLNGKGALKDFPAKQDQDIIDLENLLKDQKEVYLVNYLVQISDPDRLVAKKLIKLGYQQAETKDFTGLGFLYHYVLR